MKDKIEVERKKYEELLNELSKDISMLQFCYIALQFRNDDAYESGSGEQNLENASVYLGKALKSLERLEEKLKYLL